MEDLWGVTCYHAAIPQLASQVPLMDVVGKTGAVSPKLRETGSINYLLGCTPREDLLTDGLILKHAFEVEN